MQAFENNGHPFLPKNKALQLKSCYIFFKRVFDICFALFLLPFIFPVMFVIAILIKLDSKGSIIFTQIRTGLNEKEFNCYKFRTMIPNAEMLKDSLQHLNEMVGPVFKIKDDPRLTRIGKHLRRFSLDELPQIFNILKGEMSFVGPRPPTPSEVIHYKPWQKERLEVKPGLTCLWQISGRSNIQEFDDWVKMDIEYIKNASMKEDIRIILKTFPVVFSKKGAY